jgi:hypothetical protein
MLIVLSFSVLAAIAHALQIEPKRITDRFFINCGKVTEERSDAFPKGGLNEELTEVDENLMIHSDESPCSGRVCS